MATPEELKAVEKECRASVAAALKVAKKGKPMPLNEIYTDIYHKEIPHFIRGAEMQTSAYDGVNSM